MSNLSDPGSNFKAIAKGTSFSPICRGIYVGTAGSIVAQNSDGEDITFEAAAAGTVLPIRTTLVTAGSSADDLVRIYD